MNTTLDEIQDWYESQCNDDWEHVYGVNIKTLENPSWKVKIAIAETEWEERIARLSMNIFLDSVDRVI